MRLELSPLVEADLDAIGNYIAHDNPTRALSLVREIRAEIRVIAANPLLYRPRPEIDKDVRMGIVGRYAILFRIVDDRIRIERVVYGGRDLPALLRGDL
jgi:plasmid stabilization system protein ParE